MRREWSAETRFRCSARSAVLLDRLAEEDEVGAARLAELIGEPRSTVYRLLANLQQLELVEPGKPAGHVPARAEALSPRAAPSWRGSTSAGPRFPSWSASTRQPRRPCSSAFGAATRRSASSGSTDAGCSPWRFSLGGSLPLHVGAAPRALLAYEPRAFWEEYLARGPLEALHAHDAHEPGAASFAPSNGFVTPGCAVSDEDVVLGMAAVGAPIFDHQGEIRAALSMSGPRPTILGENAEASRELITSAAAEISRALGFAPAELRAAKAPA